MLVLSMDVGLFNMGLVMVQVNVEDNSIDHVLECKQINIKELVEYCDLPNCKLRHSLCAADYMYHLFEKYSHLFENADVILIERQPPQGFTCIQEITNFNYRSKVVMIAPQKMHNYFNMQGLTYERRKQFTVKYAQRWLQGFEDFSLERNHDISDAMCMVIYYLWILSENELLQERAQEMAPAIAEFEQFRYTPSCVGRRPRFPQRENSCRAESPSYTECATRHEN